MVTWFSSFLFLMSKRLTFNFSSRSNDVYDSDTGVDRDKKESVVNIIGRYTLFLQFEFGLLDQ